MAIGEFEYVKPPHFYMDQEAEEEDFLPNLKRNNSKSETTNPLINGINPVNNTNTNDITVNEDFTEIEDLQLYDDEEDMLEPEENDAPLVDTGDSPDNVTEIEIEIDDDSTSTQKIVVKETSKPTRGRTPKLHGQEEEIAAKYADGMTLKELAEIYSVSVPCMSGVVKRAGVEVRGRGRQKKS